MRDLKFVVAGLVAALEAVELAAAPGDIGERRATDVARDIEPAAVLATVPELKHTAQHESAHAVYAFRQGWTVSAVVLRPDGTGKTIIAGRGAGRATEIARVVFHLAGPAYELQEPFACIGPSFDVISARLRLDALNLAGDPVTFESVATQAAAFVADNIEAIGRVGLALFHARELVHDDMQFFGGAL